jgi:aryl-alcohol dehydrogenase-like predicted oxidoreductase
MRYTTFGRRTGLRVSEYGLGTGTFGTGWGAGAELGDARKIFERFAEAGGTLIDTADGYQEGQSEQFLKEFLAADRENFVLASKYSHGIHPMRVSTTGNSRKNMRRAVEASLRRLGTDYLDLYWVHFPDAMTPTEEIVDGLDDLVSAGTILHAGLSNFPAWRVARAATLADERGRHPLVGVQIEYSLADRSAERELWPMADALGLGVALWSPLAGGLLTGKYRVSQEGRLTDWQGRVVHEENTAQKSAVLDTLLRLAGQTGATAAQVAMAWLRTRFTGAPTAYVPIIGPRTLAQLDDYLGALDVTLTPDQVSELDTVSAVPLGVPHEAGLGVLPEVSGGVPEAFLPRAVPVA